MRKVCSAETPPFISQFFNRYFILQCNTTYINILYICFLIIMVGQGGKVAAVELQEEDFCIHVLLHVGEHFLDMQSRDFLLYSSTAAPTTFSASRPELPRVYIGKLLSMGPPLCWDFKLQLFSISKHELFWKSTNFIFVYIISHNIMATIIVQISYTPVSFYFQLPAVFCASRTELMTYPLSLLLLLSPLHCPVQQVEQCLEYGVLHLSTVLSCWMVKFRSKDCNGGSSRGPYTLLEKRGAERRYIFLLSVDFSLMLHVKKKVSPAQ